ncbi:MAG: tRNA lysidine(34) synthetase TilS [Clostridia bacterium]|nr:tRNA lysidine(34) synthetase TilS [Clostridia bacterium]
MLNLKLFNRGDVVAVALSGGKDSVCLLHILLSERERLGITVKAINVEHGIRGEESKRDSLFVKSLCKALNVPLKALEFDCVEFSRKNKMTVEEGARRLRYDSFFKLIDEGFCNKVATAHHLADNVETVLLNLFRGASPSGLKGIPEISHAGKIIRPILGATKEELDEYALKHGLEYVVDTSNQSDDYSRNFLRLNVIPEIKKRFPKMESAVNRFVNVLSGEDEFLSKKAREAVMLNGSSVSVLCSEDDVIFARASVIAMKDIGIAKDYDKAHIDGLLALKTSQNGKRIDLLNGVTAVKEYDRVSFYRQGEVEQGDIAFGLGEFAFGEKKVVVSSLEGAVDFKAKQKGECYFDLDKIPQGTVIRVRKDGDVFTKFGGGTKNLGDYMTDKKIPLIKRNSLPVLACGSEVLVVCGVEISQRVKIDEKTTRIAKIILK